MLQKGLLSKIGGIVALISILFLPVGGCGKLGLTGIEILSATDKEIEIPSEIKLMIVFSLISAFLAIFMTEVLILFICGSCGIAGILIAYQISRSKVPVVELKIGAFLAIIGFALVLVEGFLLSKRQDRVSENKKED